MIMNWKKVKLSDIAEIVMGQSPKSKFYNTDGDGLPFFQGRAEFGDIYPDVKKWCSKPLKIAKKNDVLMTVRAPVGDLNIAKEECIIGRGLCALRSKLNNGRFLYYLLKGNNSYITSFGSGAVYDAINKDSVGNLIFDILDEPIQWKISSILSAYDDLIENNLHRIQILEEMARLIYQEWFVNFRFPGYEKVKFVVSELGKIPEGSEVLQLGEVLESIESGSRPKGGIDPEERGVPSIGAENVLGLGRYDFGKEKYVSEDFHESMRKGKIKSGDVLLYKDGAKIGRKSMFRDGFPHEVCCINEHVFILRTNSRCNQNYLYFYLDRPDITEGIINLNANAAQPGINQAGVKSLSILLPTEDLIRLFDEKVDPIIGMLFNLAKKNQILRKKRDLLLPKLISGKLDVSDLEIATQEQQA